MTSEEALDAIRDAFHRGRYFLDPHARKRMAERQVTIHDLKFAVLSARRAEPYQDSGRSTSPGTTRWRVVSRGLDAEELCVGVALSMDHLGGYAVIVTVF